MRLEPNEIHVWLIRLTMTSEEEQEKFALLSADECVRAKRFRFPIHQHRFIAARGTLRQVLGIYLNTPPKEIQFTYNDHRKPAVRVPSSTPLQFNVTHSNDIALFAFTLNHAIGIDIEKIQETYDPAVATRFFSPQENNDLMRFSDDDKVVRFYRLWSRKEALIKAVGKGLAIPLASFSVSTEEKTETILLENKQWSLLSLAVHPDYQAAVATQQIIHKIYYWKFLHEEPTLTNVYTR